MLESLTQAGAIGLTKLTSWAMNPFSALGDISAARWTYKEYLGLWEEVEDTKAYLQAVKNQLEEVMKSELNICSLLDTIKAVNIFQEFFFENYLEDTTSNRTFWTTGPAWYRSELTNARQALQLVIQKFNLELALYGVATAEILTGADQDTTAKLKDLQAQMEASNKQCAKAAAEYRKLMKRSEWDICPVCSESSKEGKAEEKSWLSSNIVPKVGSTAFKKIHNARKRLEPLDILGMFQKKLEEDAAQNQES